MKITFAIITSVVYALMVRLTYGMLNSVMEIMSITFIFIAPFVVGFLTVIFIPAHKIRNGWTAFGLPWLTAGLILIVTMALNIEGAICWMMIFPVFGIAAGLGGLIAFSFKQKKLKEKEDLKNKIDTFHKMSMPIAMAIPLLLGLMEGDRMYSAEYITIEEELIIPTTTDKVWENILDVKPQEISVNSGSITEKMGFPNHVKTELDKVDLGGTRMSYYERGLFFKETISKMEQERLLELEITTFPDQIPPTVMDEHILVGGKHLDLIKDQYVLEKIDNQTTKVTLSSKIYINTPFNWYCKIWAHFLMSDILERELARLEQQATKA